MQNHAGPKMHYYRGPRGTSAEISTQVDCCSVFLAIGDKAKPTCTYSGWFGNHILSVMQLPRLLQIENVNIIKLYVVYNLFMYALLEERSDIQGGKFEVERIGYFTICVVWFALVVVLFVKVLAGSQMRVFQRRLGFNNNN